MASIVAATACTAFEKDGAVANPPAEEAGPACDPSAPFGSPQLVAGLTDIGAVSVRGLRLSSDSLIGYFAAVGRPDSLGGYDLYVANRSAPTAPFTGVRSMGAAVNSSEDDVDPAIFSRGPGMIFAVGSTTDGHASSLRQAMQTSGEFSAPATIALPFVGGDDQTPFASPSGILYYATFGQLGFDIATAHSNGVTFDAPIPLPGTVNTEANEISPVVSADELTLYYASDRSDDGAAGLQDVWVATRASTTDYFSSPVNVAAVNSSHLDQPTFVTPDGCSLYLASDRGGSLAMYVAVRP